LLVGGRGPDSYLFCYFPSIDSFVNLSIPLGFEAKENFTVMDIAIAKDGAYLLGTSHGLLQYYYPATNKVNGKVKRMNLEKVPLDEPIRVLYQSEDRILWISTTSGLVAYNGQSSLLFNQSSGLPSGNLASKGLLIDFDNNLWVGTSKGLAVFQNNRTQQSITPSPIFTAIK